MISFLSKFFNKKEVKKESGNWGLSDCDPYKRAVYPGKIYLQSDPNGDFKIVISCGSDACTVTTYPSDKFLNMEDAEKYGIYFAEELLKDNCLKDSKKVTLIVQKYQKCDKCDSNTWINVLTRNIKEPCLPT